MTARRVLVTLSIYFAVQAMAFAGPREEARLLNATQVLEDSQAMPDQAIPDWLLRRAQGIAVIPTVVKAALVTLGGRGGKGVLTIRDAQGRWSNPAFVTLAGGSVGLQFGLQTSDLILVFTTRRSVEGLTGGKVTLGADASVAVGPVGRQVSGATDVQFDAEVYSYSRTKGLFAGIAIDGSIIMIDHKANASYYERPGVLASDIFSSASPAAPASAQRLLNALRRLPSGGDGVPPGPAATAAPSPATAATVHDGTGAAQTPPPDGKGLESGGATTFPLEPKKPH